MREEYAFVKDSVVTNVVVVEDASHELLETFKSTFNVDIIVKIERDLIGVGATWDGEILWPYTAFTSWVKDYETKNWKAPVDYPIDDKDYIWDEATISWVEITA